MASHVCKQTGQKVTVTRLNQLVVVKSETGKNLETYTPDDMAKFYDKYRSLTANKVKDRRNGR